MKRILYFLIFLGISLKSSLSFGESPPCPRVVVSIAPLQFLAAGIMKGIEKPEKRPQRLLEPGQSPHTHHFRPSHAQQLKEADLIIYVGEGLENFLEKPIRSLASPHSKILKLMEQETLEFLPTREKDSASHQECHHGPLDPHIWLSPENGEKIIDLITVSLKEIDPFHEELYDQNAEALKTDIKKISNQIKKDLIPFSERGYIVFHDGYQYWENFFELKNGKRIVNHPEDSLSPHTLRELKKIFKEKEICFFSEAQFSDRSFSGLIKNLKQSFILNQETLDPYGIGLPEPGTSSFEKENSYVTLLSNMGKAFIRGLRGGQSVKNFVDNGVKGRYTPQITILKEGNLT